MVENLFAIRIGAHTQNCPSLIGKFFDYSSWIIHLLLDVFTYCLHFDSPYGLAEIQPNL